MMEIYQIKVNENHAFIKEADNLVNIPVIDNLEVDQASYLDSYGVSINMFEIDNYKKHFSIWDHFYNTSLKDYCMIIEEGVILNETIASIQEAVSEMPSNWEVFFPYDKIGAQSRQKAPEIFLSKFGFFWGSYIYIINKKGAKELLLNNVISLPVDEEIVSKSFSDKLVTVFSDTEWFSYDDSKSPSFLMRKRH